MSNNTNTTASQPTTNQTDATQTSDAGANEATTATLPPQQPAPTAAPTAQHDAHTEQYGAQNAFGTAYGTEPRNQATYQAGANEATQSEAAFRHQSGTGYGYGPNGQAGGFAGAPGAYGAPTYAYASTPNAPATPSGSRGIDNTAGTAAHGTGTQANGKTKLGGKTIAIIAGVTLVCGLLGGVAGGATVSALTKSDRPETSQMGPMPGGSSDGFGGQHGQSGQGDGMGQMPGGMSGSGAQGSTGSGSDSGSSSGSSGSSSSYSGNASSDDTIAS